MSDVLLNTGVQLESFLMHFPMHYGLRKSRMTTSGLFPCQWVTIPGNYVLSTPLDKYLLTAPEQHEEPGLRDGSIGLLHIPRGSNPYLFTPTSDLRPFGWPQGCLHVAAEYIFYEDKCRLRIIDESDNDPILGAFRDGLHLLIEGNWYESPFI
jgi:hypothetical protein